MVYYILSEKMFIIVNVLMIVPIATIRVVLKERKAHSNERLKVPGGLSRVLMIVPKCLLDCTQRFLQHCAK